MKEGYNMLKRGDLVQRQLRNGYKDLLLVLGISKGSYDNHGGRAYYMVLYNRGKRGKMHLPDRWLLQRLSEGNEDEK